MSPSALSSTVLPPVFGPETSSVRSSGSIARSNGTTSTPCASSSGCRPSRIAKPSRAGDERRRRAGERRREARARVQRVELDERVERRDDLVAMRTKLVGELAQNALDLLELLRLELAHPIAELHRGRRLDEQRAAGRRRVVHDAAGDDPSLAPHGNHVAAVAHRHRHVGDAMVRLEPLHLALENSNQLALRAAQLAPNAPQRGRRVVLHRAVVENRPLDARLERWRRR